MSEVILGHPYSGAVYGYFADQLQGDHSHTRSSSSYYKTLYGKNYQRYVEIALNFLLLYRHIWVSLADNPLPVTSLTPEDRSVVPELGLHLGYRRPDSTDISYYERRDAIQAIARDSQVRDILGRRMKLPWQAWEQVIDSIVFEAGLSATKRIPLLCSPGRRELIQRIVAMDRPSLHPILPRLHHARFIQSYCEFTALALAPKNLDDLVAIKLDSSVRTYGDELLKLAHSESPQTTHESRVRVAQLVKEAMHTETIGRRVSGAFDWIGKFARLIYEPAIALTASAGSVASDLALSSAGWYQFTGSVNRAVELRQLESRVDKFLATAQGDA
jgi:hypothetical protein